MSRGATFPAGGGRLFVARGPEWPGGRWRRPWGCVRGLRRACPRLACPAVPAGRPRVSGRGLRYGLPRPGGSQRVRGPAIQAAQCLWPQSRPLPPGRRESLQWPRGKGPAGAHISPCRAGSDRAAGGDLGRRRAPRWAGPGRAAGFGAGPRLCLGPASGNGVEVARLRGDPRLLRLRRASGRCSQPRPAGPPPVCKGRCGATGEDAGSGLLGLPLRRASTGHSFPGGFPPCFLDGPRPGVRRGRRR